MKHYKSTQPNLLYIALPLRHSLWHTLSHTHTYMHTHTHTHTHSHTHTFTHSLTHLHTHTLTHTLTHTHSLSLPLPSLSNSPQLITSKNISRLWQKKNSTHTASNACGRVRFSWVAQSRKKYKRRLKEKVLNCKSWMWRKVSSLSSFKSKLKTHLFSSAYWSVILPIHH